MTPKFKNVVNSYFKRQGIRKPTHYLALRWGVTVASVFKVLAQADNGVGRSSDLLDPKTADSLIKQAEILLSNDQLTEMTPIEEFLQPKIEEFLKEQGESVQ